MGLKQQLNAGASLDRDDVSIVITGSLARYTGSLDLGMSFVLLQAQASNKCRVRLYGDSSSRNDATELVRPFNSQSLPTNISLISDMILDNTTIFHLAPPIYGANIDSPVSSYIYYTIDTGSVVFSGTNSVKFSRFLLEDPLVTNLAGVNTRATINISGSMASGSSITGSIATPRTYLLLQAIPSASPMRLRLYSSAVYRDIPTEYSRSFITEPASSSGLIADIYLDTTATASLSPLLIGRNNDDLPGAGATNDLTYYTLTNLSVTSGITASLHIFTLED